MSGPVRYRVRVATTLEVVVRLQTSATRDERWAAVVVGNPQHVYLGPHVTRVIEIAVRDALGVPDDMPLEIKQEGVL